LYTFLAGVVLPSSSDEHDSLFFFFLFLLFSFLFVCLSLSLTRSLLATPELHAVRYLHTLCFGGWKATDILQGEGGTPASLIARRGK